jgi:cysteinyl-tRNA synthetase
VMTQAKAEVETFRNAFRTRASSASADGPGWERFVAALDDDFNTPEGLTVMHDWRRNGQLELLERALRIFGLESLAESEEAPPEIVALAEERSAARDRGEFEAADRLRSQLEERGWLVRDVPGGFQLVPKA